MKPLTYEQFSKNISDIEKVIKLNQHLCDMEKQFGLELKYPTLVDNVISLLSYILDDTDDIIGRWIFEKETDESLRKIKTCEDLWEYLNLNKFND